MPKDGGATEQKSRQKEESNGKGMKRKQKESKE
jgi:hypothetical protein